MTNFEIADTDTDPKVFEIADTDADTDMKIFETADTDADTDMNFLKNRGHGHGADKPRTCVSTDLWLQATNVKNLARPYRLYSSSIFKNENTASNYYY